MLFEFPAPVARAATGLSLFFKRVSAKRKWRHEHCEWCGTYIGPGETESGYRACSAECASSIHESKIM